MCIIRTESGELDGFEVQMAAEIAKRLGVKVDEADNIVGDLSMVLLPDWMPNVMTLLSVVYALHRSERKNITCQIRMESS